MPLVLEYVTVAATRHGCIFSVSVGITNEGLKNGRLLVQLARRDTKIVRYVAKNSPKLYSYTK